MRKGTTDDLAPMPAITVQVKIYRVLGMQDIKLYLNLRLLLAC